MKLFLTWRIQNLLVLKYFLVYWGSSVKTTMFSRFRLNDSCHRDSSIKGEILLRWLFYKADIAAWLNAFVHAFLFLCHLNWLYFVVDVFIISYSSSTSLPRGFAFGRVQSSSLAKGVLDCEQSLLFFRFSESNARARERRSRETRETRAAAREENICVSHVLLDGLQKKERLVVV